MGMILNVRYTVGDVGSASRICVRTIQIVDVRSEMSESREQQCRTVCDGTCYMSGGLTFGKSNVLFEIQH
jgi:hypothetical protein